ncbi:MAG: response regulator transcription factor [Bacteroidota bacterium]|jgi:two-component system alkaline phosphatase synthesis response regulator PhoP
MESHKILLVDDEQDILDFLGYNLNKAGFEVHYTNNGKEAVELAKKIHPHLIILDVMMPGMDGMETCRELREISELKNVLIAFLTARNEDYSQIAGFDVGADDYITKPIKPLVLISRVKALIRRRFPSGQNENQTEIGGLKIDHDRYIVIKENIEINLPNKEFKLLALLAAKPGKVFTRDSILQQVWGDEVVVGDRTIDVHIRKLREKLGDEYIKTIKGVGYKFEF